MNTFQNENNNMSGNNNKRRSLHTVIIAIVAILVAGFVIMGYSLSWFLPPSFNHADSRFSATDFSVYMEKKANDNSGAYNKLNSLSAIHNRVYVAGASSGNAKTDYNSVELRVVYTGESSAYIKIALHEEWRKSSNTGDGAVTNNKGVIYNIHSDEHGPLWVYNEADGCYYSREPVSVISENLKTDMGNVSNGNLYIPFADSIEYTGGGSSYIFFYLHPVIEAVQPDRFEEFYGGTPEEVFGNPIEKH